MNFDKFFIGGQWQAPATSRGVEVLNPANEQVIETVPLASVTDVDKAVTAARTAFDRGPWPKLPPGERAAYLRQVAEGLRARGERLATLTTEEGGTPIAMTAHYHAVVPALQLDYYADLAESAKLEERRTSQFGDTLVVREPVGVVAAIVPWNGPYLLGVQKIAPALAAGCTVVLKLPVEDPLTCYLLAEAIAEADLPPGVANILVADVDASEALVAHKDVNKVTFTGSTNTGKRIGAVCAAGLKRCTLELGGKSAAIILDDADLALAIPTIIGAGVAANNGESCTAQSRVLAPMSRYDEVVEAMAEGVRSLVVGDPIDPATAVGPMISASHRARVEGYIELGEKEGARIVAGGLHVEIADHGYYVAPTVFADATNDMRVAREEIFGPVAVVIGYEGDDQAIAIANDSPYGLAGTVWTQDEDRAMRVARAVDAGTFCLNTYTIDVNSPFGGYKESGIGREMGRESFEENFQYKSITLSGANLV